MNEAKASLKRLHHGSYDYSGDLNDILESVKDSKQTKSLPIRKSLKFFLFTQFTIVMIFKVKIERDSKELY